MPTGSQTPIASKGQLSIPAIVIPVVVAIVGLGSMGLIAYLLRNHIVPTWSITSDELVRFTVTMQALVFLVSILVLLFMYYYDRERFKLYFRWGTTGNSGWRSYGPAMAIFFTAGGVVMMSTSVISQNGVINESFFKLLPLVLLCAATNAWSEEIFARFVLVAGLHGRLRPDSICWISAILFGAAHFRGTPSGPFGMLVTGFMGWLLAKSVVDTKGLGWAWLIHFLGDVAVFGAGAMIVAGQS